MKLILAILAFAASASCKAIDNAAALNKVSANQYDLFGGASHLRVSPEQKKEIEQLGLPPNASSAYTEDLSKRTDPPARGPAPNYLDPGNPNLALSPQGIATYEQYIAQTRNRRNPIPEFVRAARLPDSPELVDPVSYTRERIFNAMVAGIQQLNHQRATAHLPSEHPGHHRGIQGANSRQFYPHSFRGTDFALQGAAYGDSTGEGMYEYPLDPTRTWNGGSPDAERVLFDGNGRYMGVVTHRGNRTGDNRFHWATPARDIFGNTAPDRTSYPGVIPGTEDNFTNPLTYRPAVERPNRWLSPLNIKPMQPPPKGPKKRVSRKMKKRAVRILNRTTGTKTSAI